MPKPMHLDECEIVAAERTTLDLARWRQTAGDAFALSVALGQITASFALITAVLGARFAADFMRSLADDLAARPRPSHRQTRN